MGGPVRAPVHRAARRGDSPAVAPEPRCRGLRFPSAGADTVQPSQAPGGRQALLGGGQAGSLHGVKVSHLLEL